MREAEVLLQLEERGELGRVAHLTVSNPKRLNILDGPLLDDFEQSAGGDPGRCGGEGLHRRSGHQ